MEYELVRMLGVTASLSPVQRMENIWLTLLRGEAVGIFGLHNSCAGVLLAALCGRAQVEGGRACALAGTAPQQLQSEADARAAGFFYVEESNVFVDSLTIAENIFLLRAGGLGSFWLNRSLMARQTARVMDLVGLDIPQNRPVAQLTHAQKHLLQMGRALAAGARLLLLGTTFSGYSSADLLHLQAVMERHKKEGVSFVVHCNHMEELRLLTDKLILCRGRTISKHAATALVPQGAVAALTQGGFPGEAGGPAPGAAETVAYTLTAPGGHSLRLHGGRIDGVVCTDGGWRRRFWRALGRQKGLRIGQVADLWGERAFFPNLSAAENLLLPSLKKGAGPFGLVGAALLALPQKNKHWEDFAGAPRVGELTHLQRIHLQFERWYIFNPQVLVVEEPFLYGDAESDEIVRGHLRAFAARGTAVLLLSTRRQSLEGVCAGVTQMEGEL